MISVLSACDGVVLQPSPINLDAADVTQAPPISLDAGDPNDAQADASQLDAAAPDANPIDSGVVSDADTIDVGFDDAAAPDANPIDSGVMPDADTVDTGLANDVGGLDAAAPDATVIDSGTPDAGTPDSGSLPGPRITLTTGVTTRQIGNTSGGSASSDACASDAAIVGFSGSLDSRGWHGRVQALCAKLVVTTSPPYRIVTGAVTAGPTRGRLGNSPWTRSCASDQVIVGYDGRSGALVDSLTFRCAPVTISGVPGAYVPVIGAVSNLAAIGGSGGSAFGVSDCANGQVATTVNIRAGDNIDAFGLGCSNVNAN